jgi:hypothetical protein
MTPDAHLFLRIDEASGKVVEASIMSDRYPTTVIGGHHWVLLASVTGIPYADARLALLDRISRPMHSHHWTLRFMRRPRAVGGRMRRPAQVEGR